MFTAYLITKSELGFITKEICKNAAPNQFTSAQAESSDKVIESLIGKKYAYIEDGNIVFDRSIAFLAYKLCNAVDVSIASDGTVICRCKDIIISVEKDDAKRDGLKLIPIKNEESLAEYTAERNITLGGKTE
ncbi:MAG: hypothetical protein LUI05_03515 [Oscillospiraceae bacterium]|nr:hypothetical protein [Oscillospiraceae bacterium]